MAKIANGAIAASFYTFLLSLACLFVFLTKGLNSKVTYHEKHAVVTFFLFLSEMKIEREKKCFYRYSEFIKEIIEIVLYVLNVLLVMQSSKMSRNLQILI